MAFGREIRRLLAAAVHSLSGWSHLLRTEANMRYLLLIVTVTGILAIAGIFSIDEFAVLLAVLSVAVTVEISNTALENLLDTHLDTHSRLVKRIKDMMSGAVFFALLVYALLVLLFMLR